MQIVTDTGTDVGLSPQELDALGIHIVPLQVVLDGTSYREGVDIRPETFYRLLAASDGLPTTSQPAVGDFVELYRRLAAQDPDILSIHMSSGLSGTLSAAMTAAQSVPEAHITHVDTKTLSAGAGWQVDAAARCIRAGWSLDETLKLVQRISDATDSIYTLEELKYLIHGGRISHIKGLIASVLRIKPLIGVEKVGGTYVQHGQARSFKRAMRGLVDHMLRQHPEGTKMRVSVRHAYNPSGAQMMRALVQERFECEWVDDGGPMSLVLGAHTGPSMIGVAYAPARVFEGIPE